MARDMVLVDREALLIELRTVFDVQTADTLLSVLNKVATQIYTAGVTREDFSALKYIVADVAEEQRKTAEELGKLAEAQRQNAEQLHRLELIIEDLARQLESLTTHIEQLTTEVRGLASNQRKLGDNVAEFKGRMLEWDYRNRAHAYLGSILRKPKVVDINNLWDTLEAHLSSEELDEVLVIDLIVQGKTRKQPEKGDVWLAIEVSFVVDKHDVQRVRQRAELLKKSEYQAIPVVAGKDITDGARDAARKHGVVILQDGRRFLWDEALAVWT